MTALTDRVERADAGLAAWRPSRRLIGLILVAFTLTAIGHTIGLPFTRTFPAFDRIDIDVYRMGAQVWRNGGSLYASGSMPFTTDGIWLPFTYPPFAALMFLPFSTVPLAVAGVAITLSTVVLTVVIARIVLFRLSIGTPENRLWIALVVATGALWLNPFWMTLGYGQVNVVLMALVAVDLLLVPRDSPWRGVLIGVAAAIKLTPMAFVLILLVRAEWRAALRAVGAFVGLAAVAAVWAPADSVRYWTHTVFHTDRIGDLSGGNNQSVNGFLVRLFGGSGHTEHVLWAMAVVALTALAVVAIRRCAPLGGDVLPVAVTAVWALLVSPTSWAHHWVWSLPAVLALAVVAVRSPDRTIRRCYGTLAVTGVLAFAAGPFQFLPRRPAVWDALDAVAGNAYCLWGLAVLVTITVVGRDTVRRRARPGSNRVRRPAPRSPLQPS
ncbi:glycosyltransferase 87 family protein [Williamsia phyllosphaerae]|uniref:Polyprenol-phosphate-mannose-dependent alpha-(1-2)-phosphatidylinositol mannoside mannosyltransferase n=1 Tax=Williamsia phyllosphaerae TaxID=885042 RepID=A0ABQ1UZE4_9NOCA|nr:glycosyltransferase 87 family protein [Williamsia phyllosphaerae]GGF29334.1 polyprenol-phosphate-mannose-dependent alpha-(1-2)-phosphatidylinositol mannoside mannosyltransferase [Williamsia phyllosphaerae]